MQCTARTIEGWACQEEFHSDLVPHLLPPNAKTGTPGWAITSAIV